MQSKGKENRGCNAAPFWYTSHCNAAHHTQGCICLIIPHTAHRNCWNSSIEDCAAPLQTHACKNHLDTPLNLQADLKSGFENSCCVWKKPSYKEGAIRKWADAYLFLKWSRMKPETTNRSCWTHKENGFLFSEKRQPFSSLVKLSGWRRSGVWLKYVNSLISDSAIFISCLPVTGQNASYLKRH